jgi:hypothetical protein
MEKSRFMTKEIRMLGFKIENGKIFPDEERLGGLENKIVVRSIKHLQSVIGLFGFYRNFIKNFSEKARLI